MTAGRARAHGAISAVNAIITGHAGASLAVDLRTEARVTLLEDVPEVEVVIDGHDAGAEGLLARLCLKAVVARLGNPDWGGRVETTSDIPTQRGLKSSSAAANAVVLAANHAHRLYDGQALSRADCLAAAIECALDAGVSITGAFDDATASLDGGLSVTDNAKRLVLHREELDEALRVVLLVPREQTPTASVRDLPYGAFAYVALEAHALARKGDWIHAMTMNGLACSALYGVPATWTRDALGAGALCAGVTGKGPAFAAVCPPEREREVVDALRAAAPPGASVLRTRFTNARAEEVP